MNRTKRSEYRPRSATGLIRVEVLLPDTLLAALDEYGKYIGSATRAETLRRMIADGKKLIKSQ